MDDPVARLDAALLAAAQHRSPLSARGAMVLGLTQVEVRHLIANLAQGRSYLEVGTLMGATLVAAADNNPTGRAWAVDDFSWDPDRMTRHRLRGVDVCQMRYRPIPDAFHAHLGWMGLGSAVRLLEETFTPQLAQDLEAAGPFSVVYYDGDHTAQGTALHLKALHRHLQPEIVLVDDYFSPDVKQGLWQAGLEPVAERVLPWWNGLWAGAFPSR